MKSATVFLGLLLLAGLAPRPAAAREEPSGAELARRAVAAIRAAGLDPETEVDAENADRADLSDAARQALEDAGLPLAECRKALADHPELLAGGASASPAASPGPGRPAASPPPAAGGSGDPGSPADGFGRNARGAEGAARNVPANLQAIVQAFRAGGNIRIEGGDVDAPYDQLQIPGNTTVDGGGVTFWLPGSNHNGKGLGILGHNIVVRNLRLRNSGDGLYLGSSSSRGVTRDVLIENVSVTGCGDDGFSASYEFSDATMRWSLLAGNVRCVFMKYGGRNLTMHHNILTHYWIRGPLVSGEGADVDIRNNLIQHWSGWGARTEDGARGNFVNNTFRYENWAGDQADKALYTKDSGLYADGNEFVGCGARPEGFASSPVVNAPPVATEAPAAALARVLSPTTGAGCMPRDQVDANYLECRQTPGAGDPAHGLQVEGSRLGD